MLASSGPLGLSDMTPSGSSEPNTAIREGAKPLFRSLQIGQYTDATTHLFFDRANDVVALAMVLVCPVTEVEPEHIGSRFEQPANDLLR